VTDSTHPDHAKWTRRIRHLLDLAADQAATEPERQTYAAKAAELMTRHGIEEAQVRASRGDTTPETAQAWPCAVSGAGGYGQVRARIASRLAKAMGCRTVIKLHPSPRPNMVYVIGVHADITALRTLVPLVLHQADLAAATRAAAGHRTLSYLAAFLDGYGQAVADRIRQRRTAYVGTSTGAELILANRNHAVTTLFHELFPDTTRMPAAQHRNDGHAAGRRAGATAYLGDPTLGTTPRPELPSN
jgi:hypothetical protein